MQYIFIFIKKKRNTKQLNIKMSPGPLTSQCMPVKYDNKKERNVEFHTGKRSKELFLIKAKSICHIWKQPFVLLLFLQWSGERRCRSCLLDGSEPDQHLPKHLRAAGYRGSACWQPAASRELEPKQQFCSKGNLPLLFYPCF